ncbi:hypothetical protein [Paenibacillus sp. N3.4]|nr:hypothetical protein [Paenibacillus sp. N3.4]
MKLSDAVTVKSQWVKGSNSGLKELSLFSGCLKRLNSNFRKGE